MAQHGVDLPAMMCLVVEHMWNNQSRRVRKLYSFAVHVPNFTGEELAGKRRHESPNAGVFDLAGVPERGVGIDDRRHHLRFGQGKVS